jgi:putative transposase
VDLARTLCASGSPISKSQFARALGIERLSLYVQLKRPIMEKILAVRIKDWHEQDDTVGHHKLAVLLVL